MHRQARASREFPSFNPHLCVAIYASDVSLRINSIRNNSKQESATSSV